MNYLVLGTGNFGRLFAWLLAIDDSNSVEMISARTTSDQQFAQAVGSADAIVLAIPFPGYTEVIERLEPHLDPDSVIIDVCSVKQRPQQLLHELLPDHKNWAITHPLFGPTSAAKGTQSLELIVIESAGDKAETFLGYARDALGLNIVTMDAEEHDRQMATAQALTFFISETLHNIGVNRQRLMTPSYTKLLDVAELFKCESQELLDIIQKSNPYSQAIRDSFLDEIEKISQKYQEK